MPTSSCLFCGRAAPGGVCARCRSRYPAFVPKERLSRTEANLGPGYVFRAEGAVRYDRSRMAVEKGDAPRKEWRPVHDPFADPPKLRKRTPQERLDSLTHRIVDSVMKLGRVPDSILVDIRREQIAQGKTPMSVEQLRQLAGAYLDREAKVLEAANSRSVTRTWTG